MTLGKITLCIKTVYIRTLIKTLILTTDFIRTLGIIRFSIMTLSLNIFSIISPIGMTLSNISHWITTLSIANVSIMILKINFCIIILSKTALIVTTQVQHSP
jgi:hypothetical protein